MIDDAPLLTCTVEKKSKSQNFLRYGSWHIAVMTSIWNQSLHSSEFAKMQMVFSLQWFLFVGFMIYTAGSHQEAIHLLCLFFSCLWGTRALWLKIWILGKQKFSWRLANWPYRSPYWAAGSSREPQPDGGDLLLLSWRSNFLRDDQGWAGGPDLRSALRVSCTRAETPRDSVPAGCLAPCPAVNAVEIDNGHT